MEGKSYRWWSADLYFLRQAELALATHPTVLCPYPIEPATCRLLLATCVGAIEAILDDNYDRDVLRDYFALPKRSSTKDKATALFRGFVNAGVVVDINMVRDYECLKYLRNQSIHTRPPRDHEASVLSERDWPARMQDFTTVHADRIVTWFREFLSYVIQAHFVIDLLTGDKRTVEIGDLVLK